MPLYPKNMLFTSESVTEGHPDKFCDQIADAILDECLRRDPASRVACDAYVALGTVTVGGEMTTRAEVDLHQVVRDLGREIGYTSAASGFDVNACTVARSTHQQSPDVRMALSRSGLQDLAHQGVASGYACSQTPERMPLPIVLANRLAQRLADARRKETLPFLGPDGSAQVTVEYRDGRAVRVDAVAVAAQHSRDALTRDGLYTAEEAKQEIVSRVVIPVLQPLIDRRTKITVNGGGRFLAGGPQAHTGSTGRRTACDTYGGWAPHVSAALSGKDGSHVDRSAGYMARCVAKNVVAAGLADECLVQLAYCLGQPDPVSVLVSTFGTSTGTLSDAALATLVRQVCPLSTRAIAEYLGLLEPIFQQTAVYGHFGRTDVDLPWERTELANELLAQLMKA
jgi:S-adenosylmethionine synthetase